jgi:hypothetical protein
VIGGMGQSDFDEGVGFETIPHFANNDGWFDDVSDGPVDAKLTIDGVPQPVIGACAFSCTLRRHGVRRNGRFQARGPSSLGDGANAGGVANACDILQELWINGRFAPGSKADIHE